MASDSRESDIAGNVPGMLDSQVTVCGFGPRPILTLSKLSNLLCERHLNNDDGDKVREDSSSSKCYRKQLRCDSEDRQEDNLDIVLNDVDAQIVVDIDADADVVVGKRDGDDSGGDGRDDESSSSDEKLEYIQIDLLEIRKLVQCPICLGIIKKTRTVMECMHRFCRECIDKSMRMGNNECPTCRTHCASRRSLRDDPRYDAMIAHVFEDIGKYEEEELAFHDEEKTRNKQIQVSIAEVVERQEALARKRPQAKDSSGGCIQTSHKNLRNVRTRRTVYKGAYLQVSDDSEDENGNGGSNDSSSGSEIYSEVKPRRHTRLPSRNISSASFQIGASRINHLDTREIKGISSGIGWKPEILSWGRGGTRSHARHASLNGSNGKSSQSTHVVPLVDHLQIRHGNNDELDVQIMLICLDKQSTPSLEQPFLCCHPNLAVKHLCKYVATQISSRAEEVQMLAIKGHGNSTKNQPIYHCTGRADPNEMLLEIDWRKVDLRLLEGEETLGNLKVSCYTTNHLILAYRKKDISFNEMDVTAGGGSS